MKSTGSNMKANRVEAAPKPKGKHKPYRVTVERLDNGAYNVEQHFKSVGQAKGDYPTYMSPKTHGFGSFKDAHKALPALLNENVGSTADGDGD